MVARHIVKSYDDDLNHLNHEISEMGKLACRQLENALTAILERDINLATQVIEGDPAIDQIEHDIDTFAVRMIALRQPVAKDLRNVIAALKVSSHLERIADYGTNIAKRAISLKDLPSVPSVAMISRMSQATSKMITDVVEAYVKADDQAALEVWKRDSEIDEMYMSYLRELLTYMMEDPRNISPCTQLLFVAKNIERIGDHVTNIAEMVHYLVHGTIFKDPRTRGST